MNRRHWFGHTLGVLGSAALTTLEAKSTGLPGIPHHPAKARRVIYLFMSGGPSQMELFDYKPRLRDFAGELEKLQTTALDQARQVIDETARLYKESLNYGGLLMSEWRRMALDATRQTVDTFDAAMPAPARPGARS